LLPGLFVRVRIPHGKPHQALLVPEKAILRDQRQKFLYVVNKDNKVEYRQVQLGPLQNGMRAIESGIGPNDWIIVNGSQRARPDALVAPHEAKKTTGDCPNLRGRKGDRSMFSADVLLAKTAISPKNGPVPSPASAPSRT
jgi:multidrug efflux system membrane fusion protein